MYKVDRPKTVSWYIHSYYLYVLSLVIITPDRQYIKCSSGRALTDYGHCRVHSAVLTESTAQILLLPEH